MMAKVDRRQQHRRDIAAYKVGYVDTRAKFTGDIAQREREQQDDRYGKQVAGTFHEDLHQFSDRAVALHQRHDPGDDNREAHGPED
jgi:hypothetical protein